MNIDDVPGDFPTGERIYLNNASVSVTPLETIRAMADFLTSYCSAGPDSAGSDLLVTQMLQRTRAAISGVIGCKPEEIILTQSTTDGINAVARGLGLASGSNIIIRGLGHEHHSNYYPWLRLADRTEVRSLRADESGFFEISELEDLLDGNTGLVALSHALYNTGAILPVEQVGEILEERGVPYFVDAAQSAGCIGVDVSRMRCNFMSFNGSKWLCGPMGTGLFYCREDSGDLLEPLGIGGESATHTAEGLRYKDMPEKFQTGFRNYAGMAGLERSAGYLLEYGLDNIRRRIIRLANQFRDEISKIPGATVYGPEPESERTSIVSFSLDGVEPRYVVDRLERQGIVLAVREILDRSLVRCSPHFFNTESQIQRTVEAVRRL